MEEVHYTDKTVNKSKSITKVKMGKLVNISESSIKGTKNNNCGLEPKYKQTNSLRYEVEIRFYKDTVQVKGHTVYINNREQENKRKK